MFKFNFFLGKIRKRKKPASQFNRHQRNKVSQVFVSRIRLQLYFKHI